MRVIDKISVESDKGSSKNIFDARLVQQLANKPSFLGASFDAPLVTTCINLINDDKTLSNNRFEVISREGQFYVHDSLLKEIESAREYRISSLRVLESKKNNDQNLTNELFEEEFIFNSFEKKIEKASKTDKGSYLINKLISRKTEIQKLINECREVANFKLEKLYRKQLKDLDFTVTQLRWCCAAPLPKVEKVGIKDNGASRSMSGLKLCCSNLCIACGTRKGIKRASLIRYRLKESLAADYKAVFITLNLRHHFSHDNFKVLQQALLNNFNDLTQARFFRDVSRGYSRLMECTHSIKFGFNVHYHVLLLVDENVDLDKLKNQIELKWCNNIKDKYNRTADFSRQDNWFVPVKNTKRSIKKVSSYFSSGVANSRYDISDEVAGNRKLPIWESLPPEIFANVFKNSRNVRWFSSSGLLRIRETDELPVTEKKKPVLKESKMLLEIPREDYLKLDIGNRILIRAIVKDKALDNNTCVDRIKLIISKVLEQYTPLLFNEEHENSC